MYAIIRAGGKQAKVSEGDILDIERVKGDELTFTPLLVVDDKGKVTSGREDLATARVVAKVLGPSAGPKVDVLKFKAKSGYRRRQGHRQKYSRIEVTKIEIKRPSKQTGQQKKAPVAESEAKEASPGGEKEAPATKSQAKTAKAGAKPAASRASGGGEKKATTQKKTTKTGSKQVASKASGDSTGSKPKSSTSGKED